jgi:hypothetical protein
MWRWTPISEGIQFDGQTLFARIPMPFQRRDGRKLMITPGRRTAPLLKPRRDETLIKSLVRRTPVAGTPKSIFQPIALLRTTGAPPGEEALSRCHG